MYNFRSILAFIGFTLAVCSGMAHAEEEPTLLGASLMVRPAYDGSRSSSVDPIPVLMYHGGPWFARTTEGVLEGGARVEVSDGFHLGLQAAYEEGRDKSDARFIRQHPALRLDRSLSVGLSAQYEKDIGPVPVDIVARYRKDVDTSRGDQLDLRLTVGIIGGEGKRLNAALFGQLTWADSKAMQTYYGVSAAQAIKTGLPAYHPDSGLLSYQFGLWWSYGLAPHWLLLGNIERHQLAGDAKDSPLSEVRHNDYFGVGVAYEF